MKKLIIKGFKLIAKEIATNGSIAAGTKIGEAIGARIGSKIYTPPPEEKKEEADE